MFSARPRRPGRSATDDAAHRLASASTRLAESLEWDETIDAIGRLVVPMLTDVCIVDVLVGEGTTQRLAV